ncbi:MAG TPA: hypothetical protein DIC65_00935 [Actinobacteria bacterium]|nr:hypothetical protein [Actinomycetota bacterium]
MSGERTSVIAGAYVFIVSVILAGIAVVAHNNNEPQLEWFMVMNAETGQFQDTAGEDYKLILTGVDAQALAFTDRPERQTQT